MKADLGPPLERWLCDLGSDKHGKEADLGEALVLGAPRAACVRDPPSDLGQWLQEANWGGGRESLQELSGKRSEPDGQGSWGAAGGEDFGFSLCDLEAT